MRYWFQDKFRSGFPGRRCWEFPVRNIDLRFRVSKYDLGDRHSPEDSIHWNKILSHVLKPQQWSYSLIYLKCVPWGLIFHSWKLQDSCSELLTLSEAGFESLKPWLSFSFFMKHLHLKWYLLFVNPLRCCQVYSDCYGEAQEMGCSSKMEWYRTECENGIPKCSK